MPMSGLQAYAIFCCFRILNVFLIQSQFDPDEYWQNLEPAYCQVFVEDGEPCHGLTWEWKRQPTSTTIHSVSDFVNGGFEGPLRSYTSVVPTLIFYHFLKFFALDTSWAVSRGPVFLNAVLVAAPTDWAVWYMSRWIQFPSDRECNKLAGWCSYCCLSSWFNAYTLTRTYSNALETVLLCLALCLVSPELFGNRHDVKASSAIYRAFFAFFIGGIGCSIRFTSLAAFVPAGILLSLRNVRRTAMSVVGFLLGCCAVPGVLGILATLLMDRYMYGFWAVPILGNLHFNVILGNGSLYGTHPWHWYLTAGIPAMCGSLLPIVVVDFFSNWSYAQRNLWTICVTYIVAHSFSEHKEFRFLLPILPLFCLLSGLRLKRMASNYGQWKGVAVAVALINLAAVLYLGLFHQRAPVEVNRDILRRVAVLPDTNYSVHYLMGCHSTPLFSHLHLPPVRFRTWTLDCSPECRANTDLTCESELFARNPERFVQEAYFDCSGNDARACSPRSIDLPDFIVSEAGSVADISPLLTTMGMEEVARFQLGINGIRIGSGFAIGADAFDSGAFSTIAGVFDTVALSLDEFVLFEREATA